MKLAKNEGKAGALVCKDGSRHLHPLFQHREDETSQTAESLRQDKCYITRKQGPGGKECVCNHLKCAACIVASLRSQALALAQNIPLLVEQYIPTPCEPELSGNMY